MEVENLTKRKIRTPTCMVSKNASLDPNYLRTGSTDWVEIFFGTKIDRVRLNNLIIKTSNIAIKQHLQPSMLTRFMRPFVRSRRIHILCVLDCISFTKLLATINLYYYAKNVCLKFFSPLQWASRAGAAGRNSIILTQYLSSLRWD